MKMPLIFLGLFLLLASHVAMASPSYSLEGLLPRAQTVFIGTVTEQNGDTVVLSVSKHLRGESASKFSLKLGGWRSGGQPLEPNSRYFVISQGDNHRGLPKPIITVGQGIEGQASYCGWIMFPLKTEGKKTYLEDISSRSGNRRITLERAQKMVKRTPYDPDGERQEQAMG